MFQKNLNVAIRLLWRHKGFTFISLLGLSVGVAASLLIFLWARSEYQTDRFHEQGDRIYKLYRGFPEGTGNIQVNFSTPYLLADYLADRIPEVEKAVETSSFDKRILEVEGQQFREEGAYADPALFDVFSFPVIEGDLAKARTNPSSIMLSESLAQRLFGTNWQRRAIGSTVRIDDDHDFTVEGIYQDMPVHSSLQADYVLNMEYRTKAEDWILDWGNNVIKTYLLLAPGADAEEVEKKLNQVHTTTESFREGEFLMIQPFPEAYLYSKIEDGKVAGGRIDYLRLFVGAALFLLLIACINFVNLATARASRRAKEVGVRKVIGARRGALFQQFMAEAALLTGAAIGLALLMAELALPVARRITDSPLEIDYSEPALWSAIGGFFLVTTLLSGVYPALVLSSFRPLKTLKGNFTGEWNDGLFRKALVMVQFCLSFLLIAGALVVHQQVDYIQNKNLGLDRENLLFFEMDKLVDNKSALIKEELRRQPGIARVTRTSHAPIEVEAGTTGLQWPGKPEEHTHTDFRLLWTEPGFLETFGVSMAAGRFFREGVEADTRVIVINETAAEIIGMEDILDQPFEFWGEPTRVIGIVKDFHLRSLFEKIPPMVIVNDPSTTWSMFVKPKPGETEAAIAGIQQVFADVLPGYEQEYEFLDERYAAMYRSEATTGRLARIFALLAVLISCLGLLGLAAFTAQQRTREIGIRKVLGASIADVVILLNRDFGKLLLVAIVLAVPVSFYLLRHWLDRFAYHIELSPAAFLATAGIILLVALLTVSFHSLRAATTNPADTLQDE